jgi:hypothetical protein
MCFSPKDICRCSPTGFRFTFFCTFFVFRALFHGLHGASLYDMLHRRLAGGTPPALCLGNQSNHLEDWAHLALRWGTAAWTAAHWVLPDGGADTGCRPLPRSNTARAAYCMAVPPGFCSSNLQSGPLLPRMSRVAGLVVNVCLACISLHCVSPCRSSR